MERRIEVQMIGAPVGLCDGVVDDAWRKAAQLVTRQLLHYYGDQVNVEYFDLLEPDCPVLPSDAQLPLVLVDGRVLSSGDKLSTPALRRHLDGLGVVRVEREG